MSSSNGSSSSKLCLNVAISKEKSTVLFAEADGDAVNILLSIATLPLGNVVRILEKHYGANAPAFGSLTTLTSSVNHVVGDAKKFFDKPTDSFKVEAFVEKSASFIIMDNLLVMPVVSGSIETLKSIGIKEIDRTELTTISIDDDDIMDLLHFSLSCETPLTAFIQKKSQKSFNIARHESRVEASSVKGQAKYIVGDDLTVKLSSVTSTFSIINSLGVSLSDVKDMDFQIGLNEALNVVLASLSSTTAFTDVLINRMPKNSLKRLKIEQLGSSY